MQNVGTLPKEKARTVSERKLQPKQWIFDPDDEPTPPGTTGPPARRPLRLPFQSV